MLPEQFELHAKIEDRHWWFTARRRIVTRLTEDLIDAGASVLDLGCGTGANIAAFAGRFRCTGTLPGLDGLTATGAIKDNPDTRDIPVVTLTAHAMRGDEEKAKQAGCDTYISKPIDTRQLPVKIREILDRRPQGNSES